MIQLVFVLFSMSAMAQFNTGTFSDVALKGYDPVAYFPVSDGGMDKPVKGSEEFTYKYMNATFQFSSKANLEKFKADPAKFAPQYGGYCAWAVSQGYTADIDPTAFDVKAGKLYLNYNKSVQRTWRGSYAAFIKQADQNWPRLR